MDKEVLVALKGSIEKWEKIANGTGEDKRAENCPLCILIQAKNPSNDSCNGCPVRGRSYHFGCTGTPYSNWAQHHNTCHQQDRRRVYPGTFAKGEVGFLDSESCTESQSSHLTTRVKTRANKKNGKMRANKNDLATTKPDTESKTCR